MVVPFELPDTLFIHVITVYKLQTTIRLHLRFFFHHNSKARGGILIEMVAIVDPAMDL